MKVDNELMNSANTVTPGGVWMVVGGRWAVDEMGKDACLKFSKWPLKDT